MKSKKNNTVILAYHEELVFKKFKENIKFTGAVSNLKIEKATINFEMDVIKFLDDYPKMQNLRFLFIF